MTRWKALLGVLSTPAKPKVEQPLSPVVIEKLLEGYGMKRCSVSDPDWSTATWYLQYDAAARQLVFCVGQEFQTPIPLWQYPKNLNHLDRIVFL